MQFSGPVRCLILACGNTLRGDDGVGMWLAEWAEEQFRNKPEIQRDFTTSMDSGVGRGDCSRRVSGVYRLLPGLPLRDSRRVVSVEPCDDNDAAAATHQLDAPQLLALARELYASLPRNAKLLTVGACSMKLGEELSSLALTALPEACRLLENTVLICSKTAGNDWNSSAVRK